MMTIINICFNYQIRYLYQDCRPHHRDSEKIQEALLLAQFAYAQDFSKHFTHEYPILYRFIHNVRVHLKYKNIGQSCFLRYQGLEVNSLILVKTSTCLQL